MVFWWISCEFHGKLWTGDGIIGVCTETKQIFRLTHTYSRIPRQDNHFLRYICYSIQQAEGEKTKRQHKSRLCIISHSEYFIDTFRIILNDRTHNTVHLNFHVKFISFYFFFSFIFTSVHLMLHFWCFLCIFLIRYETARFNWTPQHKILWKHDFSKSIDVAAFVST